MTYFDTIRETAEKSGMELQDARYLHSALCKSNEPGAQFAAIVVQDVIKLLAEAKGKLDLLATLAHCLPVNSAQNALVAALEAVHAGFQDGSIKWAKPRQSDSDPYHPANTLMCQALELARQE